MTIHHSPPTRQVEQGMNFIHTQLNHRWTKKLGVFVLSCTFLFFLLNKNLWPTQQTEELALQEIIESKDDGSSPKSIKTILLWNAPQRPEVLIFGTGHDTFVQHRCPVSDCELINSQHQYPNRSISSYDAIVFNINDQFGLDRRPKPPRHPTQRYIFFTQEPPPALKDQNLAGYRNFFNWTMTYRMDSDIRLLYGRIRPKQSAPNSSDEVQNEIHKAGLRFKAQLTQNSKPAKRRRKLVAAMISHCHTDGRREDYIKQLKKHVQVDVFGWCEESGLGSGLRCDTHELLTSSPECYDMLEANYDFYLSFENAICKDYVTEKFFQVMSRRRIVPVVYGGADYASLAPQHSYIDALQYEPSELAQYLKKLAANRTLYHEYLWWKDHYVVESGLEQMVRHAFCDLCEKLHTHDRGEHQSYSSLASKWHPGRCYQPNKRKSVWSSRRKGLD